MCIHLTGFSVCVVLFSCLVASTTHAQSEDVIETREVVVSSTRLPDTPVDARTLPAKVTIITAEDIQKSGAKTVQEAIQWATGIVMYDGVGNAFQQTIDLRGFNGQPVPATSVFVDGQRINEPDFNAVNFNLIPYETIERIEIIPGAAAIYGKNAMGGVINIITKRGADKHQATGETLFGSFHRERYSINASGPIGKLDYYTNFGRETESGFRDESAARISRFFGKIGYRPSDQTDITLSYTYVQSHLQQAGSLPLSMAAFDRKLNFTPGDFEDHETNVVRLTGRQSLPFGFSLNVNGFYRRLAKDLFTVGQTSVSRNPGNTESRGGTVQLSQQSVPFGFRNTIVLGSEFTRNDFGNTLVGDFGGFIFKNSRSTDEDIFGLYIQDTLHLTSQIILTGGIRYDHDQLKFQDFDDVTNNGSLRFNRLTPRAGITYLVTQATSLYANYSQGFRVPTVDELFAQGPGFQTNFGLKAAKSDNYEVGVKNRLGGWGEASLAVFQANVRDEIFFTCNVCDFTDGRNRNIDRSRRRGVEATLKGRLNQYFDGIVNYTYTQAEFRSQFNLSSTRTIQVGDSFSQVPKHRLSVTGNMHPAEGWTVSLIGLYVSTQFFQNDEENVKPRLPGYFLLNSRIAYERPVPGGQLSAFLLVNNLLDQKYSTSGIIALNAKAFPVMEERFIVPAAGIAIYGGLSYRFEGL